MNNVKTVMLLGLLTGLFLFIGNLAGGQRGMLIALALAAIMNLVSYWFSDRIILRVYGAKELSQSEAPRVYAMVQEMAQKANIPMPRIYAIDHDAPNAFATGRNPRHAAVAVTRGLINLMDEEETKGVIAHELSHVFNRDTLISAVAATIAGAILVLVRIVAFFGSRDNDNRGNPLSLLLMLIFAPLAAFLIQMSISRSREYKADASAAQITGNPEGLASALGKLAAFAKKIPLPATRQTAHLFIVSPFSGKSLMSLFSTHPPIEERIARLRALRLS